MQIISMWLQFRKEKDAGNRPTSRKIALIPVQYILSERFCSQSTIRIVGSSDGQYYSLRDNHLRVTAD